MSTPVGPINVTITTQESGTVQVTQTPAPGLSLATNGPQGAPGTKIYQTNGQPSNSVGLVGDFALDINTGRFYGPKVLGGWPSWSQIPAITEPGWYFNGLAEKQGGDIYLTRAGDGFGAGSAWYGTAQPTEDLDVTFDFEMSGGTGADGIVFAFADASTANTFVGGGGGDLGIVGATSTSVAFISAPGEAAKIVTTDATSMTTVIQSGALDVRPNSTRARIKYDGGVLYVWLNDVQIFNQTLTLPTTAKIGFAAANGGSDDNHIIRNVSFVPVGGMMLKGEKGDPGKGVLVLNAAEAVPAGTPVGTVILRRPA
ncbi:hypothetical protein SEA_TUNATARTARE_29 [Streptomyces phage TunaTartare]|uniref:Uncharacterized protein n=1 Tax=Streptomyces phage TunaTartare TaxID=2848887 RepID=A0A8F2E6U3_9CAUD|nr:hypothetical protein PP457_gp221 [Streptomyces phage TunaTartare]QWT29922.1 hypothetical protein SEA_TUNATARTARE_29 [Streptomyces phage TunaTartare]